jgi:hypothetical protein
MHRWCHAADGQRPDGFVRGVVNFLGTAGQWPGASACSLSVTVEPLRPREIRPLPEPSGSPRWLVEDVVDVSVDGDGVRDPDDGSRTPAVVVRMPAYVARHLACLLDDWSTIGRLLESARGGDERDLAGALYEAAREAEALHASVS